MPDPARPSVDPGDTAPATGLAAGPAPAELVLDATLDRLGLVRAATGRLAPPPDAATARGDAAALLGRCLAQLEGRVRGETERTELAAAIMAATRPVQWLGDDGFGGSVIVTALPTPDGARVLVSRSRQQPLAGDGPLWDPTLLQVLVDLLPVTVSVKDESRRYRFVNRHWEAYAGLARADVIGRRHEELTIAAIDDAAEKQTHSDDIRVRDHLVLTRGEAVFNHEERYRDQDRVERTWLSQKVPLVLPDGRIGGILSTAVDITARKQAEAMLARAKQRAEAANLAKSQFLSVISHEFRTPLHGMIGMIELLRDTPLDATQQDFFDTLQLSARSLLTLVDDILELIQVEAGQLRLEPDRFEPMRVVAEVVELCQPAAQQKGLALVADLPPLDRLVVVGDARRLRQVLVNLLGNAIKFTDQGRIEVALAAPVAAPPGRLRLTFAVTDTGIGIEPAKRTQLFRPFVQADSSSTRRHGGAGLGLALSRHLVEAMGGTIGCDSTPGVGSRFFFDILADQPVATTTAHPTAK